MRRYGLISGLCLVLVCMGGLSAAELPVPTVEYSADRIMSMDDEQVSSRVYHAEGKERNEMEMAGMRMVTILRPDKKLMWAMMPSQGFYQEMPFGVDGVDEDPTGLPDGVALSKIGPEILDGKATTKYRLTYEEQQASGLLWLSQENIPLRMEYSGMENGEPVQVTIILTNLRIEKQDPALFEVPADYTRLQ